MNQKCRHCRKKFPAELISEMCINGDYLMCCPLCALWLRNLTLGLPPDTPFNGETAVLMYEQAMYYDKNRPVSFDHSG